MGEKDSKDVEKVAQNDAAFSWKISISFREPIMKKPKFKDDLEVMFYLQINCHVTIQTQHNISLNCCWVWQKVTGQTSPPHTNSMVAFRSGQTRGPPLIQTKPCRWAGVHPLSNGGRFAQHQHYALVQASSWGSSYPSESKNTSVLVPCRAPRLTRQDVGRPGMHSYLWRMLRYIMSTQERLHRLTMPNTPLPLCSSCYKEKIDSLKHALLKWSTKKA